MTNSIPTLFTKDHYDEFIDEIADDELDVLRDELYPDLEASEFTYDTVHQSVAHSGNLHFGQSDLIGAYHDVDQYSDTYYPGEPNIDPQEVDLLAKAAEFTRYLIISDVANEVRNRLDDIAREKAVA